jgi:hypothetical protein
MKQSEFKTAADASSSVAMPGLVRKLLM